MSFCVGAYVLYVTNKRLAATPKAITNVIQFGRVDSVGETPGYISNPEVKSNSGEGSARGTVCENSETRPLFIK